MQVLEHTDRMIFNIETILLKDDSKLEKNLLSNDTRLIKYKCNLNGCRRSVLV